MFGHSPRLRWKRNPDGAIRSVSEAVEIARAHRVVIPEGQLTIEEFGAHTSPTNPGNLHCEAWDVADEIVEEMRRQSNDL